MLLVTGNLVTSNNGQCMKLYNSVGYHKVTDLHTCIDVIQYAAGNWYLVTSNRHCMELYKSVGYHKVTDLHTCIDVIQYAAGNR